MKINATIKFQNGFSPSGLYNVINHDGSKLLIFQTLDDGTRLCLRLDEKNISEDISPWAVGHFYAGSVDASPEMAIVLPADS